MPEMQALMSNKCHFRTSPSHKLNRANTNGQKHIPPVRITRLVKHHVNTAISRKESDSISETDAETENT